MSRRKLVVGSPTADYGPELGRDRKGRPVLLPGRDVRTVPDPADKNRNIQRAQVRCVYDDLWAFGWLADGAIAMDRNGHQARPVAGRLSGGQREAADRLALQYEAMHGARTDVGGSPGWQRSTLPERQLQAASDLREARERIHRDGCLDWTWLVCVVVWNRWPKGAEDAARLARLLQELAELWGME